jgi:short-subunit dehydrogenase
MFSTIGLLVLLYVVYQIGTFLLIHLIRAPRNSLYHKYKDEWALITGATDGIGKAYSLHLASYGINIILLGRNEAKLKSLKAEIENLHKITVIYIVLDCSTTDIAQHAALQETVKQIQAGTYSSPSVTATSNTPRVISIVINNVGGQGRDIADAGDAFLHYEALTPVGQHYNCIAINLYPMISLNHFLLKSMKTQGKGIILGVSSSVSTLGFPFVATYAGAKSFLNTWTKSINNELLADLEPENPLFRTENPLQKLRHILWDKPNKGIFVEAHICGEVNSASIKTPPNFLCPTSEIWAKSSLEIVGCGRNLPLDCIFSGPFVLTPHFSHALINNMLQWLWPRTLASVVLFLEMWKRKVDFKKTH